MIRLIGQKHVICEPRWNDDSAAFNAIQKVRRTIVIRLDMTVRQRWMEAPRKPNAYVRSRLGPCRQHGRLQELSQYKDNLMSQSSRKSFLRAARHRDNPLENNNKDNHLIK